MFAVSPDAKGRSLVSPQELAEATTEQCFLDADLDQDGGLSFEEFRRWYSQSGPGAGPEVRKPRLPPTVEELCRLTNLRAFDVTDVADLFKELATSRALDMPTFCSAFRMLRDDEDMSVEETDAAEECTEALFGIFDADGDGIVDHAELISGLSVLCRGSHSERVRAAFDLYDQNGDGFISVEVRPHVTTFAKVCSCFYTFSQGEKKYFVAGQEMRRYLCSVYRLLYTMKPEVAERMKGVGPEELANVTSKQGVANYPPIFSPPSPPLPLTHATRIYTCATSLKNVSVCVSGGGLSSLPRRGCQQRRPSLVRRVRCVVLEGQGIRRGRIRGCRKQDGRNSRADQPSSL